MNTRQEFFTLLNGKVKFRKSFYNPTCDSIWLASSIRGKIKTVLDVGAGTGAVSLFLLSYDKNLNITCLEKDSKNIDECVYNANLNNCNLNIINDDIFEYKTDKTYDLVITNPPYFKGTVAKHNMHHNVDIYEWIRICAKKVKPMGYLNTIVSQDNLQDVFKALNNFGDICVIPLFSSKTTAERVIISARLNVKTGTSIYNALSINDKKILSGDLTIFEYFNKVKNNV